MRGASFSLGYALVEEHMGVYSLPVFVCEESLVSLFLEPFPVAIRQPPQSLPLNFAFLMAAYAG